MTLKALIFDVDGTLANTERDGHRIAYNQAFRALGLDWDWTRALYGQLLEVTGGKERIRHYIHAAHPDFVPDQPLDEFIARLHAVKTEYYTGLIDRGAIPLRPGVERLLRQARANAIRLAVATTTTYENVTALIECTLGAGAMKWFEVVGAGDVVPEKKPAPDIYLYVLKMLELAAAECLAFEDSHNGLRSAQAAGLKTLITVNDYTRNQDFSGAALVLDQLGTPDQAFQVLAGSLPNGHRMVDIDLLREIHAN